MLHFFTAISDDILFIDHDVDGAFECFEKEKSNENESLTTSVSDNTFYDTDGASNYYRDKCDRKTLTSSMPQPPPPSLLLASSMVGGCEHDAQIHFVSDWASTGDDTSFYDDRSGALRSVVGHFRSITPHKSSRGAYFAFENPKKEQYKNQTKHFNKSIRPCFRRKKNLHKHFYILHSYLPYITRPSCTNT